MASPAVSAAGSAVSAAGSLSAVDWSDVPAVRLLGVALGALALIWAIRMMFGRRR